ncbi:MAG: hypothetical protein IJX98_01860 [Clostridia bacterium]|nr:hypothetical protein [Clostridia bacterium]
MKRTKKGLLIGLLSVCAAALIGVSAGVSSPVKEVQAELIGSTVRDNYTLGEAFTMPSSVTVETGDGSYEATEGYIVYPDGLAYSGSSFALNTCGQYKVVYQTTVGGTRYVAEKSFFVEEGVYSVGAASSVSYGALNSNFSSFGLTEGLLLEMASDDTFYYKKPINIYEDTWNEIIAFNCIQEKVNVGIITIRLTDCYDSSNYMDLIYHKLEESYLCIRAGAQGQASVGLAINGNPNAGKTFIDGTQYNIFRNTNGTGIASNRYTGTKNNIKLYLDTTSRKDIRVYVETAPETVRSSLVTEFNNPALYNYEFNGFTTGEVFLSVSATSYSGVTSAPIQIGSIMGVQGEALQAAAYTDEQNPTVKVDENAIGARLVAGATVSVPKATAYDPSGIAGEVNYSVYYNYGTDQQSLISVSNGQFIPKNLGKYTVEYSAKDTFGNVGTATLDMYAVKEGTSGIDFTNADRTNADAGDQVDFGGYQAKGVNGDVTVSVTITLPSGKTVVLDGEDKTLLLEKAGVYGVVYAYTDGVYSYVHEYELNAASVGKLAFNGNIVLPKYLIKNAEYSIEGAKAYRFTDGAPMEVERVCSVSYDGGITWTACDGEQVEITGSNTAKFRYACKDDPTVYIESEEVMIVDVNYTPDIATDVLDVGSYFVGNATATASNSYVQYVPKAAGDTTLDFINPISLSNFEFGFFLPTASKLSALTLTLTDYYNRKAAITFTLTKRDGVCYFSADGGAETRLASDYHSGGKASVLYNLSQIAINATDRIAYNRSFTTDKCLLSVTMKGADTATQLQISQICKQDFRTMRNDTIAPMIYASMPEEIAALGDTVVIPAPTFTDVLTPILNKDCFVTVYLDGTLLKQSVSDFTQTYSLDLEAYGNYQIVYSCEYGGKKPYAITLVVSVIDNIAPEITITRYQSSIAVDEKIAVEFSVSDNVTASEDISRWMMIMDENNVLVKSVNLAEGTVKLQEAGTYTVFLYCSDAMGNSVVVSYQITVA